MNYLDKMANTSIVKGGREAMEGFREKKAMKKHMDLTLNMRRKKKMMFAKRPQFNAFADNNDY